MFGRRKTPPNTPFPHDDRCKTPAAEPEWFESKDHRWQRVCSCGEEYREMSTGEVEPNGWAAEPAKSAHEHAPECEGSEIASMVKVEFSSPDRAWRSHCMLCTTTALYWYQPDRTEMDAYGDPRPVRRAGNVRYAYELAREQAPA